MNPLECCEILNTNINKLGIKCCDWNPCLVGAVAILPTILYLTTGVIKESATKSIHDPTVMATAVPVTAALHCLKTLATNKYCKDERSGEDWYKLLQSALAKVIDLAKTGKENIVSLSAVDWVHFYSPQILCNFLSTVIIISPVYVSLLPG